MMKTTKLTFQPILIVLLALTLQTTVHGQEKKKQIDSLTILTSAVCEMCKTTLENGLAFEKGVKRSSLNVDTKVLTVWYRTDKTNAGLIKKAVTDIGYDADSIPANAKAYERLDECCKKGYHK